MTLSFVPDEDLRGRNVVPLQLLHLLLCECSLPLLNIIIIVAASKEACIEHAHTPFSVWSEEKDARSAELSLHYGFGGCWLWSPLAAVCPVPPSFMPYHAQFPTLCFKQDRSIYYYL